MCGRHDSGSNRDMVRPAYYTLVAFLRSGSGRTPTQSLTDDSDGRGPDLHEGGGTWGGGGTTPETDSRQGLRDPLGSTGNRTDPLWDVSTDPVE